MINRQAGHEMIILVVNRRHDLHQGTARAGKMPGFQDYRLPAQLLLHLLHHPGNILTPKMLYFHCLQPIHHGRYSAEILPSDCTLTEGGISL